MEARRFPSACVASPHHLASAAGLAVLASGGNALDAAVATNLTLGVVTPYLCGYGGDLFALIWNDGPYAYNGAGRRRGLVRLAGTVRDAAVRHPGGVGPSFREGRVSPERAGSRADRSRRGEPRVVRAVAGRVRRCVAREAAPPTRPRQDHRSAVR